MHPDEAVQLAIQDLRTRGNHPAPPAAHGPSSSAASRLLHAYFAPLRWYVAEGRTPVADEGAATGHLPRPRLSFHERDPADAALAPLGVEVGP